MFTDNWIQPLAALEKCGQACVMVTVLEDKGSTPRGAGTKMLVTQDGIFATIGGGHLEHVATEMARQMLTQCDTQMKVETFNLGARLGQCCGGIVTLMFEPIGSQLQHLVLFGAGHVGKALIHILQTLPFKVTWVDERAEQFPDTVPNNVVKHLTDDPVGDVAEMPAGSLYLVLTHNHQLDLELAKAIIKRGDSRYFGMIGSESKKKRFIHKLKEREFTDKEIARMTCPIGIEAVQGKHPAEIAVSVAGELISLYQKSAIQNQQIND